MLRQQILEAAAVAVQVEFQETVMELLVWLLLLTRLLIQQLQQFRGRSLTL
jgi:hypothetical protein